MEESTIKDLAEFLDHVGLFEILWDLMIFRGQPVKRQLLPAIARKDPKSDTTQIEKKVIEQLCLLGVSFLSSQEPLELLVTAQHFRLKTRLLDWTSNPLAALWFACSDPKPGDVWVYALRADDLLIPDVYKQDPFDISETLVVQPRSSNARVIAQHGWFTLHGYSASSGAFVALEDNPKTDERLTEMLIPEQIRIDILMLLDRCGISSRTLFPDLEGLCRYLNKNFK